MLLNLNKVYEDFIPRTGCAAIDGEAAQLLAKAVALQLWIAWYPGFVKANTSADLDEQDRQMLAEASKEANRLSMEVFHMTGSLCTYTEAQADRQLYATRKWSC